MRNLSRQEQRGLARGQGVPRPSTGQKGGKCLVKAGEIRVGKYKYDPKEELGKGYSSNVYKGMEILKPHKRYAIKVITLKNFRGHNLAMLDSQIEIHHSLDYPHIVRLHQVIKTPHHYYLIMEYCPHGNLAQYINQKKILTESNALQILKQIISAYKYLLGEGVIHRDIKPANILRMGNQWKLSDFGFATRARLGFKDRVNVGTPLYMAPESIQKNYYSYKSDLFSIGMVLYEMLVGQCPHNAANQQELMEKKGNQVIVPKHIKNNKVIEFLNKICMVSQPKRMNRQEFQSFDFGILQPLKMSNTNSTLSIKTNSTDQSSLTHQLSMTLAYLSTDENSKPLRVQAISKDTCESWHEQKMNIQQPSKTLKNPMMTNQEILTLQLQFVHHHYFLIKNIDSLHLESNLKNMLILTLFKLVVKNMRLLCDKNLNYLNLTNWEQYLQCKLYQQLYSQFIIYSEKYEKEYLEFIKHNDIKVIRAVNRKFPELGTNSPLPSKFYQNLKNLIAEAIKEHNTQVNNLITQGEQQLHDRFKALQSLYTLYRLTEIRRISPVSSLLGQKPNDLEDYTESKLTKIDYNNLRRLIKDI